MMGTGRGSLISIANPRGKPKTYSLNDSINGFLAQICFQDFRLACDLGGTALCDFLPVVDHRQPITKAHDHVHNVLDDDQSHAALSDAADNSQEIVEFTAREPGCDLVEKNQLGLTRERPGQV